MRGTANPLFVGSNPTSASIVYCSFEMSKVRIAIDMMGGDSLLEIIKGVQLSIARHQGVVFKLFGDKNQIDNLVPDFDYSSSEFYHTEKKILSDDLPSKAVRSSAGTSMKMAIDSVSDKEADAIVSAGNTGALMSLAKISMRTIPGISRPAICSVVPTKKRPCVLLDMGANIDCDEKNLLDFATMGDAFLTAIMSRKNGKIGLLNIGSEQTKGNDVLKKSFDLMRSQYKERFYGYVEPGKVFESEVDIVVTDGFNGNILIKTAEGVASLMLDSLKESFNSNLFSKLGYLISKNQLKSTFKKFDPRVYNGAMFVGLNGICIKSHGGTDHIGFSRAVDVSILLSRAKINDKISSSIGGVLNDGMKVGVLCMTYAIMC